MISGPIIQTFIKNIIITLNFIDKIISVNLIIMIITITVIIELHVAIYCDNKQNFLHSKNISNNSMRFILKTPIHTSTISVSSFSS